MLHRMTFLIAIVALVAVAGAGPRADHASSAAVPPTVRVTPATIERGHAITVTGRHWPRHVRVQLLIGPPRSEADPVGSVRTSSRGSFRRTLTIPARSRIGRRVLLACRRECRVKASAVFRVTD